MEEKAHHTSARERFKRLGVGFKKRLLKFSIVSLIGLCINLLALNFVEFLLYRFHSNILEAGHRIWIFSFTYIDLLSIAAGIAAATFSNYLLNKIWTFEKAKVERVTTQFLKYAIVGASGAVLKYLLTTALKTLFLLIIPSHRWATVPASAVAFIVTVFWNYIWNEVWTFEIIPDEPAEPFQIAEGMKFDDVTIIIPTYNERENIEPLMNFLDEKLPGVSLIVADDGSTDGTREQVKKFHNRNPKFKLLDREKEPVHGLTISVLEGIKKTETPYFVVMDCDFQHPPEKAAEIAMKLHGNYHFVVGERDAIPDWPFSRRLISWGASVLGRFSLWMHRSATCGDVMSGFFGGKTDYVKKIIDKHPKKFRPEGYKVMFELLKLSPRKKTKIARVGYIFNPRVRGESKISKKHIFEFLKSAFP